MRVRAAIAGLAIAVLSAVAVGCGGGGDGGDGGYTMVMIPGTAGDEFYYTVSEGAKAAAAELGIDLEVQFPSKWDPAVQTSILNAVIAKNPDAILIAPTDAKAMIGPLQEAVDRGIKIVTFDTTLEDTSFLTSQVILDDVEAGRQIGNKLLELTGSQGKLLFISVAPGISTTDRWIQGFQEVTEGVPGVEVLDIQYSDNEEDKAATILQSTLQRYPDLAGAFLGNLVSERGAVSALKAAGKAGELAAVAFDATPPEVADLKAGTIDALVSAPAALYGAEAVRLAKASLDGEEVDPEVILTTCLLEQDTVDASENQDCLYRALP